MEAGEEKCCTEFREEALDGREKLPDDTESADAGERSCQEGASSGLKSQPIYHFLCMLCYSNLHLL